VQDHKFSVDIKCGRRRNHSYQFIFKVGDSRIGKIGQFPSVADISLPQLVRYRRILGTTMYKEFSRAVGLATHGVGIGSFVYLRRILENLIESAHQEARKAAPWDEKQYVEGRTVERILLLKGHLPEFMVRNRLAYGILSKGIHELTEDECLKYFKPLKSVIELILNEHILLQEHERNVVEAEQSLADVHKEISEGG